MLNTLSFVKYLLRNRLFSNKVESIFMCSLWCIFTGIFIYFGLLKYLILFWFVPLLLVFPVIGWFIEIAEHYPLIADAKLDLYASRNRNSNIIECFLFGIHNESYHLTHHLKPGVPYWNIKRAHKIMLQDKNYAEFNYNNVGIFSFFGNSDSILKQMVNYIELN